MKFLKTVLASAAFLMVSLSASAQDYNRITFGYSPMKWTVDFEGLKESSENIDGVTLNYTHGFSLSEKAPLFLEVGGGLKVNNMERKISSADDTVLSDYQVTFFTLVVPVSLTYRIPVTNKISIAPYAGAQVKYNLVGKYKQSGSMVNDYDESIFDNGGKRFQLGYQAGVNVNLNHFVVGAGYQGDLTDLGPKTKSHGFLVNVGYNF